MVFLQFIFQFQVNIVSTNFSESLAALMNPTNESGASPQEVFYSVQEVTMKTFNNNDK